MKSANKATEQQADAAELVEGRVRTEENTGQTHTLPAQNGQGVSQGLAGVRKVAQGRRQECILILAYASTPNIRGRSRMR
jgi:hypothetical protein